VPFENTDLRKLLELEQPGSQAVVDVTIVICDLIGQVRDLRFERRPLALDEALTDVPELAPFTGTLKDALTGDLVRLDGTAGSFEVALDKEQVRILTPEAGA